MGTFIALVSSTINMGCMLCWLSCGWMRVVSTLYVLLQVFDYVASGTSGSVDAGNRALRAACRWQVVIS